MTGAGGAHEGGADRGGRSPVPPGEDPARIGVFGGTFDPPHAGHLAAAQDVLESLDLEGVLFVPAACSPHKRERDGTSPELRLRMVRAAVEDDPRFEVSDVEVRRGGASYTVDTLRHLRRERPDHEIHLIIGADQWATFDSWKDPGGIVRLARIAVMTREGEGAGAPVRIPGTELPPPAEVPVTRFDLSSTLIRRRVGEGRSIRYLVPDPVRRIIESARLYV